MLLGERVSTNAFMKLLGVGKTRYYRLQHRIMAGHVTVPPDGRADAAMLRESPAAQHVDTWLNWAYNNLAESYAEVQVRDFDDAVDELIPHTAIDEPKVVVQAGHQGKEWTKGLSPSSVATASITNEKWMHELAIAELYDIYTTT